MFIVGLNLFFDAHSRPVGGRSLKALAKLKSENYRSISSQELERAE